MLSVRPGSTSWSSSSSTVRQPRPSANGRNQKPPQAMSTWSSSRSARCTKGSKCRPSSMSPSWQAQKRPASGRPGRAATLAALRTGLAPRRGACRGSAGPWQKTPQVGTSRALGNNGSFGRTAAMPRRMVVQPGGLACLVGGGSRRVRRRAGQAPAVIDTPGWTKVTDPRRQIASRCLSPRKFSLRRRQKGRRPGTTNPHQFGDVLCAR